MAGYFSRNYIALSIKRLLYQKGIDIDIDDYIGLYKAYIRNKPSRGIFPRELALLPILLQLQGGISIDIIIDLLPSKLLTDFLYIKGGKTTIYNLILVIYYYLLKIVLFILVRKDIMSKQFVYVFVKLFFVKYNILDSIIIDRGLLFISDFQETFIKLLKIKYKLLIAFYP